VRLTIAFVMNGEGWSSSDRAPARVRPAWPRQRVMRNPYLTKQVISMNCGIYPR
jgi:hypothetical protein